MNQPPHWRNITAYHDIFEVGKAQGGIIPIMSYYVNVCTCMHMCCIKCPELSNLTIKFPNPTWRIRCCLHFLNFVADFWIVWASYFLSYVLLCFLRFSIYCFVQYGRVATSYLTNPKEANKVAPIVTRTNEQYNVDQSLAIVAAPRAQQVEV